MLKLLNPKSFHGFYKLDLLNILRERLNFMLNQTAEFK